ncbi:MAG: hypothetical protein WCT14_08670, partial [Treponemataceae bacterium]
MSTTHDIIKKRQLINPVDLSLKTIDFLGERALLSEKPFALIADGLSMHNSPHILKPHIKASIHV